MIIALNIITSYSAGAVFPVSLPGTSIVVFAILQKVKIAQNLAVREFFNFFGEYIHYEQLVSFFDSKFFLPPEVMDKEEVSRFKKFICPEITVQGKLPRF